MPAKLTKKATKQPTTDAGPDLLKEALERLEPLAESQLEMSRMFIDRGKKAIARRRLKEILELYPKSASAIEAKKLLEKL